MSLDVRKITNGKENFIYVLDELKDEEQITLYRTKEEVPKSIRHYVRDDAGYGKTYGCSASSLSGLCRKKMQAYWLCK